VPFRALELSDKLRPSLCEITLVLRYAR